MVMSVETTKQFLTQLIFQGETEWFGTGSSNQAAPKAAAKAGLRKSRENDQQMDDQINPNHQLSDHKIIPMTDPWCCYIW